MSLSAINFPTLDFKSVESLLNKRFAEDTIRTLKDIPMPKSLENLYTIAECIKGAILQKKRIVVVGDYDVDGVVSCAILHAFFAKLNYPLNVEIPNRFSDGYGLSASVINRLDCDVIITADNGINAIEAAKICKEKGITLLITDHHTPQDILPDALICNPKLSKDFPEPEICGACVVWYLCAALKNVMDLEISMVEFLDLLALAIVSDVMPLRGVNFVLLKKGLEILKQSQRTAMVHLREHFAKHNIDAQLISYYIAPLLNCAGRMDSASLAYRFLVENNKIESKNLLEQLLAINAKRKALQMEIYTEVKEQFCTQDNFAQLPCILAFSEKWHEGIVGIIAARLNEEFAKPCIVLTQKDGILKGSMRSTYVDCMQTLESLKDYLCAFGGHFGAAGLSLKQEHLEDFKNALMQLPMQTKIPIYDTKDILGFLSLNFVNMKFFKMLQSYAPFGHCNAIPKFCMKARITNVRYFGAGHSQVSLRDSKGTCNALVFGKDLRPNKNQEIFCVYSLQWDKYAQDVILYIESYEVVQL